MRLPNLTFGKVLAGTATVLVISGGTGYAAARITTADIVDETIKSVDIRNETIRGTDILDGTIRGTDIRNRTIKRADIEPSARLPRALGVTSNNVVTLDGSYVVVSSLELPPGRWHITAKNVVNGQAYIECQVRRDAEVLDHTQGFNDTDSQFVLPGEAVLTVTTTTTVVGECWGLSFDQVLEHDMYALEVAPDSAP